MFRHGLRRSPFRLFALLVAAGLAVNLIVGLAGGALAAGVGVALFLPFVLFKLFFVFMVFNFAMHVFGGRRLRRRRGAEPMSEEEAEYQDAVRRARERLDEIFPRD